MADNDDINTRKDKQKINSLEKKDMKPYVDAIKRRDRLHMQETKGIRDLFVRSEAADALHEKTQQEYDRAYKAAMPTAGTSDERVYLNRMEDVLTKSKERSHDLSNRYSHESTEHLLMLNNRLANEVGGYAKENVSFRSLSPTARARAMEMTKNAVEGGTVNEATVAKQRRGLSSKLERYQDEFQKLVKDPDQLDDSEKILSTAAKVERTKRKITTLEAAEQVIKKKGLDTESIYKSSNDKKERILSQRDDLALQYKVEQGKTGSMAEESNKLDDLTNKFLEAHEKFIGALDESPEALEEFKKSVLQAGKSMDDQKKIVDEMNRQSKGNRNSAVEAAKVGALIGQGLQTAGSLYSQATVGAENQQMSQRAQFARIQNQSFMDHYNAAGGDMMSLAMIQSQAIGRSTMYGEGNRDQAKAGLAVSTTGDVVSAGADILASANMAAGPLAMAGNMVKAAQNNADRVGSKAIDLNYGLTENQAAINSFQTRYDLSAATNQVKGLAMQSLYDQSAVNLAGSQNLGSRSNAAFDQMQNSRFAMASMGISKEEQAGMYQTAVGSMGDVFTKRGAGGMQSLVTRAAQVNNSGITTGSDYLSRIGQMAQVGGGDKQIEDILANAVARGVDDAKSFGDMVDSISQLSSGSAAKGVDTSGVATRSMLGALDAAQGNGLSQRLNLNSIQGQMNTIDKMTGDTGLTFASMIEQSQISNKFSDVTMAGRANIGAIEMKEAKALQDAVEAGDTKKLRAEASRLGIAQVFFDKDFNLRTDAVDRASDLVNIKKDKTVSNLSALTSSKDARRIIDAKASERTAADIDTAVASGIGLEGADAYNKDRTPAGRAVGGLAGGRESAQIATKAAPALRDAKMAGGSEAMGVDMAQIAAELRSIATSLKPQEAATKANLASSEMTLDTGTFGDSVTKFDAAIEKLIAAIGEKGAPGLIRPPTFANTPTTVQPGSETRNNMRKAISRGVP